MIEACLYVLVSYITVTSHEQVSGSVNTASSCPAKKQTALKDVMVGICKKSAFKQGKQKL